jgi:hypothetical protein
MRTRLNTVAPDLEETVLAMTPARRRAMALSAVRWALDLVQLSHPVVEKALVTGQADALDAFVRELDERYFLLQESKDSGRVSEEEILRAFALARTVSALEFAIRDEPLEALYEVGIATDNWPALRNVVLHGEA